MITRRFFLVGAAAAVAAVKFPLVGEPGLFDTEEGITRLALRCAPDMRRDVFEVAFHDLDYRPTTMKIFRHHPAASKQPIVFMNGLTDLFWTARLDPIIFPPGHQMRIEVEPDVSDKAWLEVVYRAGEFTYNEQFYDLKRRKLPVLHSVWWDTAWVER